MFTIKNLDANIITTEDIILNGTDIKTYFNTYDGSISSIEDSIEGIYGTILDITGGIENIGGSISSIEGSISSIEGSISSIEGSIVSIGSDIIDIEGSIVSIGSDIIDIEGSIVRIDGSIADIVGSIVSIGSDIIDIEGSIVRIDGSIADIVGSIISIGSDIIDIEGSISEISTRIKGINTSGTSYFNEISSKVITTDYISGTSLAFSSIENTTDNKTSLIKTLIKNGNYIAVCYDYAQNEQQGDIFEVKSFIKMNNDGIVLWGSSITIIADDFEGTNHHANDYISIRNIHYHDNILSE